MKKILITASVQSHVSQFHISLMSMLKEYGWEVHIAAKNNLSEKPGRNLELADKVFDAHFARFPFHMTNLKAYKELKRIIDNESYDVIHCNTPACGVITRLAARKARKKGTKIIYTAHGFHFYKGAPWKNWFFYYPVEKLMSRYTDKLITIVDEDYHIACKKLNTEVWHIHGVGVNERFHDISLEEKFRLREELGFNKDDFIITCTGELNKNKNQSVVIKAVSKIKKTIPDIKLILLGNGPMLDRLKALCEEYRVQDNVIFAGYKTDLEKFISAGDVAVSASKREGLGLNIIEAMLSERPVVASINRGHSELINDGKNGYLFPPNDYNKCADLILKVYNSNTNDEILLNALETAEKYKEKSVTSELRVVYHDILHKKNRKFIMVSPKNRPTYNFRSELLGEFLKRDFDVLVTGPNRDNIEKINELGVRFLEIAVNKTGTNPFSDIVYLIKLCRLFKKERPDVVFSYTAKPVIYGTIAAKLAGVKNINAMIAGVGYSFISDTTRAKILKRVVTSLYKIGLNFADNVIFQNSDDMEEFTANRLVNKDKCNVVNGSGVNIRKFPYVNLPDDLTFCMVSRLLYSKGVREYLKAAELVKKNYPEVRFILLGALENMKDSLRDEEIRTHINNGTVEYYDDTDDVTAFYKMTSVLVLPSYREGTPRTVLEAMAMGRPVITTDVPGCRETVIEGETGFLVPPKNPEAVAAKIEWFINNKDKIKIMGDKAYEFCKGKYEVNIVNKDMLRLMKID